MAKFGDCYGVGPSRWCFRWFNHRVSALCADEFGKSTNKAYSLMGQDGIYLQVMETSGEGSERRHAHRVHNLLKRGKHWVLVTLLLSNVIVNETLPIILDRALGGGVGAVVGSTVLIGTIYMVCYQVLKANIVQSSLGKLSRNRSVSDTDYKLEHSWLLLYLV